MPDKAFLDTNILIYAYSEDEPLKRDAANNILKHYKANITISLQVVNELINVLFKKFNVSSSNIQNVVFEIRSNR